jgi:hypothetical protein
MGIMSTERRRDPRSKPRRYFKWRDPFSGQVHTLREKPGVSPHPYVRRSLNRHREAQRIHPFRLRRSEDLVIRVKLLKGGEADIALGPLLTTAGWDGDPSRSRTWWVFKDGSSLVVTLDGHWILFGIDWSSLWQCYGENNPPQWDREARELTPCDAAALLKRQGRELPDRLKGIVLHADHSELAAALLADSPPSEAHASTEDAKNAPKADAGKAQTVDDLPPVAWKLLQALLDLGATDTGRAVGREEIAAKARVGNAGSTHVEDTFKMLMELGLVGSRRKVGTWLTADGREAISRRQPT